MRIKEHILVHFCTKFAVNLYRSQFEDNSYEIFLSSWKHCQRTRKTLDCAVVLQMSQLIAVRRRFALVQSSWKKTVLSTFWQKEDQLSQIDIMNRFISYSSRRWKLASVGAASKIQRERTKKAGCHFQRGDLSKISLTSQQLVYP
jgi:hypothetical protein